MSERFPLELYAGQLFIRSSGAPVRVLGWDDPWHLAALDPWPQLVVTIDGQATRLLPQTLGGLVSPLEFEAQAVAMVEKVAVRWPKRVTRGWAGAPIVEWERVAKMPALPEELEGARGDAYRSGRALAEERAIAARSRPSSLELLLDWLASSPERPWRSHPRGVRLTDDALYAMREGDPYRLPLSTLRARVGPVDDDAVYVFGRRTRLVLPWRGAPCPVRSALDARLVS